MVKHAVFAYPIFTYSTAPDGLMILPLFSFARVYYNRKNMFPAWSKTRGERMDYGRFVCMSVSVSEFGHLPSGEAVLRYTITNKHGASASFLNYGATWQSMFVPNRKGELVDVDKPGVHDVSDFWEPIKARSDGTMVLDPNEFYILASREAVSIPPEYAAEMVPYNPLVGEFRVHYAGFFDPGFGYSGAGGAGSRAVLEVRSHEVPFILSHGQIIGRLVFERLTEAPERVYGQGIGANSQAQGLKLSKHFKV